MVDRNAILAISVLAVFVATATALWATTGESSDNVDFAAEPATAPRFVEVDVPQQSDVRVITSSGSSGAEGLANTESGSGSGCSKGITGKGC